jgi:TPR repeat protein
LDDGVNDYVNIINKAKNSNGNALDQIGFQYLTQQKDYSKALAWCQLSANQNHPSAYNNIAYLYRQGLGVSMDCPTALE